MRYCDVCALERNYPLRPKDTEWTKCEVCGRTDLCSYSEPELIRERDARRATA